MENSMKTKNSSICRILSVGIVIVVLLVVVFGLCSRRLTIEGQPTEIRMIHYYQDAPGTSMSDNRTDITFSDRESIEAVMDEISGTYTMEIFAEE